jgi:hypothetical protein
MLGGFEEHHKRPHLNMRLKGKGLEMSFLVSGALTPYFVSAAPRSSAFSSPTPAKSSRASCNPGLYYTPLHPIAMNSRPCLVAAARTQHRNLGRWLGSARSVPFAVVLSLCEQRIRPA